MLMIARMVLKQLLSKLLGLLGLEPNPKPKNLNGESLGSTWEDQANQKHSARAKYHTDLIRTPSVALAETQQHLGPSVGHKSASPTPLPGSRRSKARWEWQEGTGGDPCSDH